MQLQSDIDLDFGIDIEQQLENFSWVRTDENMNAPLKEEDPNLQFYHTYKDLACSASSSLESYSGLFGKSSDIKTPKLETGGNPGPLVDPNLQYSNLSFLNDPKLQQLAEWNLLGSPADYYVSQILEASYRPQFGGNWPSSETLNYPFNVFDDPLLSRVKQSFSSSFICFTVLLFHVLIVSDISKNAAAKPISSCGKNTKR